MDNDHCAKRWIVDCATYYNPLHGADDVASFTSVPACVGYPWTGVILNANESSIQFTSLHLKQLITEYELALDGTSCRATLRHIMSDSR